MKYISLYSEFENKNEGMKNWLSTFLLASSLGLVPLHVKTSDAKTKMDFVEKIDPDKKGAMEFIDFINKNNISSGDFDEIWTLFSDQVGNKFKKEDIKRNITKNGKKWEIEKDNINYDFSSVDINNFRPVNYLTDMGNFIPDSLEKNINNLIYDYEKLTSVEICIITVDKLDVDIFDYSQTQFNRIGIGKKGADNGILVVFSMQDRESRIHTGRGIEYFLTDAKCRNLLENVVKPNFKEGDYYKGTFGLINSIKEVLGDEAFEEKVKWLEEKRKKEALERAQMLENVKDFFLNLLLLSIVLGSIGYLIFRSHNRRKVKKEIEEIKNKLIKKIDQFPKEAPIDSKILKLELEKIINYFDSIDVEYELKKSKNLDDKLKLVEKYDKLLNSKINDYQRSITNIRSIISNIKGIDTHISQTISLISTAIIAYKNIKEHGYNVDIDTSGEEKYKEISKLGIDAKETLYNNIDSAILKMNKFIQTENEFISKYKSTIDLFNKINYSKKEVLNSKSAINRKLLELDNYKKWDRSGEIPKLKNKIDKYYAELEISTDYLKLKSNLDSLIRDIDDLISSLKSNKRRSEYSSRSSSSSSSSSYGGFGGSSSSSGFGGFGGGSSGGGGASSGW